MLRNNRAMQKASLVAADMPANHSFCCNDRGHCATHMRVFLAARFNVWPRIVTSLRRWSGRRPLVGACQQQ